MSCRFSRYLGLRDTTLSLSQRSSWVLAASADHMDYSSPQSFGRHVRTMLRLGAVEFRDRYDGEGMLLRFRDELVLPFLSVLRRFSPLAAGPRWARGPQAHGPAGCWAACAPLVSAARAAASPEAS